MREELKYKYSENYHPKFIHAGKREK